MWITTSGVIARTTCRLLVGAIARLPRHARLGEEREKRKRFNAVEKRWHTTWVKDFAPVDTRIKVCQRKLSILRAHRVVIHTATRVAACVGTTTSAVVDWSGRIGMAWRAYFGLCVCDCAVRVSCLCDWIYGAASLANKTVATQSTVYCTANSETGNCAIGSHRGKVFSFFGTMK